MRLLEKSVNKWTEKIEQQVNILHDKVDEKVSSNQIKQFINPEINKVRQELTKIRQTADQSEKVSSRLAEDVFEAIDLNNRKLADFEDRFSHLTEWVEDLSKTRSPLRHSETLPAQNNPAYMTKSDLMKFEKKLNGKILESLDDTNMILKKLKAKNKDLDCRVRALEQKRTKSRSKKKLKGPIFLKEKPNRVKHEDFLDHELHSYHTRQEGPISKNVDSSLQRSFRNVTTGVSPCRTKADIIRTVSKPSTSSMTDNKMRHVSKDRKEKEEQKQTLKELNPAANDSKNFTEFMTFEENSSSGLFDLSDNDSMTNSNLQMKHTNSSRSSSVPKKERSKEEDDIAIQLPQKRSRIQEFEYLKQKKKNSKIVHEEKEKKRSARESKSTPKQRCSSKKKEHKSLQKLKSPYFSALSKKKLANTKARKKAKMQKKRSNIKLAKLEKMYQELAELETKC